MSWVLLVFFWSSCHKTTFSIFFSSPGQNKSSLRGSYGGGGQDEAFPLEPLLLRQGEQRLCHIPYGAKTTGISGEVAVPLKWCEVSFIVSRPAEGEIKGALWKLLLEALHRHRK